MAKFKLAISDPKTGKSNSVELEGAKAVPLLGRRLGEELDGSVVGLSGVKLRITGGTDKDGFPLREDVHGGVKAKVILSGGTGFKPKREGERRRKTIRGNMITEDTAQINLKIIESKEAPSPTQRA
ncbi:30S ribosomal protein S6e [Candidatus Hecatella orcuttiae]|jgi:small subunit ribosomal protein S6e|uniref:30S ribosomal protein S6e n=1 Tax=Candidatus Hecatella orcuttiae TaxID=1935119 RepID=UPI0028682917|nr:30S ribosomal protein S6e [Candidatus Hecatella orcuttiae]